MRPKIARLKNNWGFWFFLLASFCALIKVVTLGQSGHYDIFRDAALMMWKGQIPYGTEYPSGYFLYSPSCALFFYGAFAWLPYTLGLAAYLLCSWVVLFFGIREFSKALDFKSSTSNILYFLLSSEVIGTLLNARIETFICGITLVAGAWILSNRHIFWAYFLLAMLCNFKMQAIPTVGLLLLVSLIAAKNIRPIICFLASILFWSLAPFLVKPWQFVIDNNYRWNQIFIPFLNSTWRDFQHIYRFLQVNFRLDFEFHTAQIIGATIGIFIAGALGWRAYRDSAPSHRSNLNLRALALGSGFIVMCSPMSQSAGYILYAPLLFASLYFFEGSQVFSRKQWTWIIGLSWFFISLAYSDLAPKPLREIFFDHAVKAFGILIILAANIVETIRRPSQS